MYFGVEFDAMQDLWAGRVELGGQVVYEDYALTEEGAVILRELAVVANSWPVQRNLPRASLAEVVRICAAPIIEDGLLDDDIWHETVERTGMQAERFRELAKGSGPTK